MWTNEQIRQLTEKQRAFFRTGVTLDVNWRRAQLKKLKAAVQAHEKEITDALADDLGAARQRPIFATWAA